MRTIRSIMIATLMALPLMGCWGDESSRFTMVGEEREVSGTVTDAKLTLCSPTPDKPGTCEGTLLVEPHSSKSGAERVTVQVTRDVQLKKDGQAVFLPALRGSQVTIKYRATKEGPSVATAVTAAS